MNQDQRSRRGALASLAAVAVLAAACGGAAKDAGTTTAAAPPQRTATAAADNGLQLSNKPHDCLTATQRQHLVARSLHEAAVLRRLAAPMKRSEMGTPKLQHLTDRFLTHLATSKLDNYYQNRLIDKAAAAVGFACEQCFQMLEASRPIPAMQWGSHALHCG
jgi:hypothetical protein